MARLPIAAISALPAGKRRRDAAIFPSGTKGLSVLIHFSRLAPRVVAEEVARKAEWRRILHGLFADFPKAEPGSALFRGVRGNNCPTNLVFCWKGRLTTGEGGTMRLAAVLCLVCSLQPAK